MCGMVYADAVPIVTQSPYDLEGMMAILITIFGAMPLTLSEKKTERVRLPISTCVDDANCIQRIAAKIPPDHLVHLPRENTKIYTEINRRIRAFGELHPLSAGTV